MIFGCVDPLCCLVGSKNKRTLKDPQSKLLNYSKPLQPLSMRDDKGRKDN